VAFPAVADGDILLLLVVAPLILSFLLLDDVFVD
jgi:hypothetical protein